MWKCCKNIVDVTTFFYSFIDFITSFFFFFSFWAMALPQLPNFFFPPGQQNGQKELRQYYYRNSTKVGERKIKSRREKFLIFDNGIAAIPSGHFATRWKIFFWQLWPCHCRKWKKKKMLRNLWKSKKKLSRPQYSYNIFTINHR